MPAENVTNRLIDAMDDATSGLDVQLAALTTVETVKYTLGSPLEYRTEEPKMGQVKGWPWCLFVIEDTDIEFLDTNGYEDHVHQLYCAYCFHGEDRQAMKKIAERAALAMKRVIFKAWLFESYCGDDVSITQVTDPNLSYGLESAKNLPFDVPGDIFASGDIRVTVHERVVQAT